jgi:hypothetical protein
MMEEYYTALRQARADLSELIDLISMEMYSLNDLAKDYAVITNLDDALSGLDAALMIYPRSQ